MSWIREPDAEPIPGYRLIKPLGTGGFGEVWKCLAPGNIFKAIKFVYGNLNSMDGDAYRAEQEYKAMQRIKEVRHPFVLSIERIDEVEGDLAIVMELADKSLHDLYQEYQAAGQPGIPRDELLRYLRDAADGLDFLNEKHNLQHLDVKPRNLFLFGPRVKVADFGLVKNLERQSSSGLMSGVTPIYAPPETFSGKICKSSDQYSLAVVYIELLTGKRVFNGKNIRALAMQHVSETPDLSIVPEQDRPILLRALAKDPEKRFPSCVAFIEALMETSPDADEAELGGTPRHSPEATPQIRVKAKNYSNKGTRPDSGDIEISQPLDVTRHQSDVAVLRPTLIIGLGGFGRRALLDLRCRLLDRCGDLKQVPIYRFLYIDSDPEAVHKALSDIPEVALSNSEVFPMPLQPLSNYRRRTLEHLNDWLPREKLYAIPRSLQPQGSRALGRLAFHDNYLRFMTRLRREFQIATHPESLAQSVAQTGIGLRESSPQVFVLASAQGGSSGLLVDLGQAVYRQMAQQHLPAAPPVLFLFCGATTDPATPAAELANTYATLTELNHYCDPTITFAAQYGANGQPIAETHPPFAAAYLLTPANRTPQAQRDSVTQLANYLSHEMTTPLGACLEAQRKMQSDNATPFRSFGTHSIWFPRGLLLRVAARQVCERLLREWQEPELTDALAEVEAVCARALSDPGLHGETLAAQIERAAYSPEGTPAEITGRLLDEMSEDAKRLEVESNPGFWAQHAIEQLDEWIGTFGSSHDSQVVRRSRFSVLFANAVQFAAEEWERRLLQHVAVLMDRPGRRLAAMEEGLARLITFCDEAAHAQLEVIEQQHALVRASREKVSLALEQCRMGRGSLGRLFGAGPQRAVSNFLEQLRNLAYTRLAEDTLVAGGQFFQKLRGRLEERLADMSFCRQRLRALQQSLAEPHDFTAEPILVDEAFAGAVFSQDTFGALCRSTATIRLVLPDRMNNLDEAARELVAGLNDDDYLRLDEALQALVLAPLGGLQLICEKHSDLGRILSAGLIDQTTAFLGERLPMTDVAQAELFAAACSGDGLEHDLTKFMRRAEPSVPGRRPDVTYLLHPGSEASQQFAAEAQKLHPGVHLLSGSSPHDLTFCREQGSLGYVELQPLLPLCRTAYKQLATSPPHSPHARFDLAEWLPLEP
jgi:eukaryotic-like serine/threonine-protein kinase